MFGGVGSGSAAAGIRTYARLKAQGLTDRKPVENRHAGACAKAPQAGPSRRRLKHATSPISVRVSLFLSVLARESHLLGEDSQHPLFVMFVQ
jgi:hypothetical protein